jgi:phosphoglycolate phosphatase-like HAD superfamily hydrolase
VALPAAVLDIDGTLVDTNYHHALCWYEAMRQHDVHLPLFRIHRAIGMGGDQLVPAVAGEDVEREQGDDIRTAETALYMATIATVSPLPGAAAFVRFLVDRGHDVVLSSSAKAQEADRYVEMLGVGEIVAGWTTSADVEETKPEPDVIKAGLEKLGNPDAAVMIGDSVFDVEAAARAGLPTIGLLTGGFGRHELEEAGAEAVFASLDELREAIGKTPLSG